MYANADTVSCSNVATACDDDAAADVATAGDDDAAAAGSAVAEHEHSVIVERAEAAAS
jgi:hypothetical protein